MNIAICKFECTEKPQNILRNTFLNINNILFIIN